MNDVDAQHIRLKALELASGICNGRMMTLSASNDWKVTPPDADEVISEAAKLVNFIQGK